MRPGEIDFSSRTTHFFDISNGEVLASHRDLREYIANGGEPEMVRHIGSLLRSPVEGLPMHLYDPVDYSSWDPCKLREYGRWVKAMVEPPDSNHKRALNGDIFDTANRLGLGAGTSKIRKEYGGQSNFYIAIGAQNVKPRDLFSDWDIDRFVEHVRKVGGDKAPTKAQLNALSKVRPSNPSAHLILRRFSHIGGFVKVVELAGYAVIDLWECEDYVDWGVRFMRANDGIVPTAKMIDYLSQKKRGPSASIVHDKFVRISLFQAEIKKQYLEDEAERQQDEAFMLEEIRDRIKRGTLPIALFNETAALEASIKDLTSQQKVEQLSIKLILQLYAKYIVVDDLLPRSSVDTKISLCQGSNTPSAFVVACRKHSPIDPAEIEYTATTLGVFDTIWPMDYYHEDLKIDTEFEAALADKRRREAAAWHLRKSTQAIAS